MIRAAATLAALLLTALPLRAAVDIEAVTSPGGITAWLVEDHALPFVALDIRFRGGAGLDREGKRGAVNLMAATLEEGAGDMDAQAFARAQEALAADYEYEAFDDSVRIGARFLTESRDAAVDLLRAALVEPTFSETAVARVREQVLSGLASDATDPGEIAQRAWDAMAFPDHPYGSSRDGTLESVAALGPEDVRQAHRDVLARDRIVVGAVGDVTPAELGAMLDRLLGDLPETGAPLPGEADFEAGPGTTVIPFDTPQSVILFGHEGIPRDDEDFFAAYIVNEIFGGGGFNSRLMAEVREERGLTYGIGTWLGSMENGAVLMGRSQTQNARVGEAVEVIRDEWRRISEGVTEEELEEAKTYLTGAYPLRFDGNAPIAQILAGMQMQDLPIDYIATRNDQVMAVTLEDARRVAARIYDPEALRVLVVGQPDGVEPTD